MTLTAAPRHAQESLSADGVEPYSVAARLAVANDDTRMNYVALWLIGTIRRPATVARHRRG